MWTTSNRSFGKFSLTSATLTLMICSTERQNSVETSVLAYLFIYRCSIVGVNLVWSISIISQEEKSIQHRARCLASIILKESNASFTSQVVLFIFLDATAFVFSGWPIARKTIVIMVIVGLWHAHEYTISFQWGIRMKSSRFEFLLQLAETVRCMAIQSKWWISTHSSTSSFLSKMHFNASIELLVLSIECRDTIDVLLSL